MTRGTRMDDIAQLLQNKETKLEALVEAYGINYVALAKLWLNFGIIHCARNL